jgi:hypothetical protein
MRNPGVLLRTAQLLLLVLRARLSKLVTGCSLRASYRPTVKSKPQPEREPQTAATAASVSRQPLAACRKPRSQPTAAAATSADLSPPIIGLLSLVSSWAIGQKGAGRKLGTVALGTQRSPRPGCATRHESAC